MFHKQRNDNVLTDQNTGYGKITVPWWKVSLIPPENLQDLKGFRALGHNAFVQTTCRQALERFFFLAAKRNILWIWSWRKEITSPISTSLVLAPLKSPLVCAVWGSLWASVGNEEHFSRLGKGWEEVWSHDDEENARHCIQISSWLNYSCYLLYFLGLFWKRLVFVAITKDRWELVG